MPARKKNNSSNSSSEKNIDIPITKSGETDKRYKYPQVLTKSGKRDMRIKKK